MLVEQLGTAWLVDGMTPDSPTACMYVKQECYLITSGSIYESHTRDKTLAAGYIYRLVTCKDFVVNAKVWCSGFRAILETLAMSLI